MGCANVNSHVREMLVFPRRNSFFEAATRFDKSASRPRVDCRWPIAPEGPPWGTTIIKRNERTFHDSRLAMSDNCSMRVDMHVIYVGYSLIKWCDIQSRSSTINDETCNVGSSMINHQRTLVEDLTRPGPLARRISFPPSLFTSLFFIKPPLFIPNILIGGGVSLP